MKTFKEYLEEQMQIKKSKTDFIAKWPNSEFVAHERVGQGWDVLFGKFDKYIGDAIKKFIAEKNPRLFFLPNEYYGDLTKELKKMKYKITKVSDSFRVERKK